MNALEELRADQARASAARFFLRIGQAGSHQDDNPTLPLFSFMDFMKCEGLLADDELRRCREAIARAAKEWRA